MSLPHGCKISRAFFDVNAHRLEICLIALADVLMSEGTEACSRWIASQLGCFLCTSGPCLLRCLSLRSSFPLPF